MSENNKDNMEEKPFNLDTILNEHLGIGMFQIRVFIIIVLLEVFDGASTYEYVFTAAKTPNRCIIPECDSQTPEFAPSWILNAVPGKSNTSLESCRRYASASSDLTYHSEQCPQFLFDTNNTVPCEANVYQHTNTVVYDFDLGCDEWRRSLIGSTRMFATMLSFSLTGYVSDKWGRNRALTVISVAYGCVGVLRCLVTSYSWYLVSVAVEAVVGGSVFTTTYILATESTGSKTRVIVGAAVCCASSSGSIFLAMLAWLLPHWKHLNLAIYGPPLLSILFPWILPESTRWHLSQNQYEECKSTLKTIAELNNKKLDNDTLNMLKYNTEEQLQQQKLETNESVEEQLLIIQIFKQKQILLRCVVCSIWFATFTFTLIGMSVNAVSLAGNASLNFALVAVVQIPGYLASTFMDRLGRKPVLIVAFWICAACMMACLLLPQNSTVTVLVIYLLAKTFISLVASSVMMFTSELFPTKYRQNLYSVCVTIGRLGGGVAPLTPALATTVWWGLPFVLYGSLCVLSGLLVFFVPETTGVKMPDTMTEATHISDNKFPK